MAEYQNVFLFFDTQKNIKSIPGVIFMDAVIAAKRADRLFFASNDQTTDMIINVNSITFMFPCIAFLETISRTMIKVKSLAG